MESLFLLRVRENVEIAGHEIISSIVDWLPVVSLNTLAGELHICEGVSEHFGEIVEVDGTIFKVIKLIENNSFPTVWEFNGFDHFIDISGNCCGLFFFFSCFSEFFSHFLLKENQVIIVSEVGLIIVMRLKEPISFFNFLNSGNVCVGDVI